MILIQTSCATVPHTGRRQFNMVSDQQVNELGYQVFREIGLKENVSKDAHLINVVSRVTDRITKSAESIDKPGFQWEVKVLDKDVPNAFCLPGGKIVIYSGIIPYAKNEAGLATIISHEVAHAVARHGAERMSQHLAIKGVINVGGQLLKGTEGTLDQKTKLLLGALGMGGTVGILLPFSRVHEFEADKIGQRYMGNAGYDPSESIRLWERMSQIKKPELPIWLSTHPADADRINQLKQHLPAAQKLYNEAPEKFGLGTPF